MFSRRMNVVAPTVIGLALTAGFLLTGFIHSAAAFEMLGFETLGAAWLTAGTPTPRAAALRCARFLSFAARLSCFASSRLRFAWLLKLAILLLARLILVRHPNTYGAR